MVSKTLNITQLHNKKTLHILSDTQTIFNDNQREVLLAGIHI
jgi:hypothetical protein